MQLQQKDGAQALIQSVINAEHSLLLIMYFYMVVLGTILMKMYITGTLSVFCSNVEKII